MRRVTQLVSLAVTAGAMVTAVGTSTAATPLAGDLCTWVITSGTVPGDRLVGPYCIPYKNANLCHSETVGFEPWAEVKVHACVPAIVSTPGDGTTTGEA